MAELKPIETCPNGHRYNAWKYGDTCKVCGAKLADKEKTEEEWKEELEMDPYEWACGALLCIKGFNKGRIYIIKRDKNFLGSDPNMDICIRGDKEIVKKNHAVILYDDKTKTTMLLPGESKGMVYHKNKAVYAPIELAEMDKIEIGLSSFYFKEICGSQFNWNDIK